MSHRRLGQFIEGSASVPSERPTTTGASELTRLRTTDEAREEGVTDEMVNRFLSWRLPPGVHPDGTYPSTGDGWLSGTNLADELADVLTYLDLLAAMLNVDLGAAAVSKFNEVSERVGFPDRIAPQPAADVREVTEDDILRACTTYNLSLGGKELRSKSPHEIAMRRVLIEFAMLAAAPSPEGKV